jgi:Na+/H+ antiporter NhaD/arsenite permease-like protein
MTRIEDRSWPVLGYKIAAHITFLILLVQPFLAGQFLYGGEADLKDVHGILGEMVLSLTALAQLIFAFLGRRTFGTGLSIYNLVLFVLIVIQAGIGRSDEGDLIAIHIPLGTILLTLGAFAVFLAFYDLRRQPRPSDSTEM